ncbi:MAG: hypothetical protein IIZ39_05245 [Blautia sp.]|nr:hypothetical protein [Blautia sp.]
MRNRTLTFVLGGMALLAVAQGVCGKEAAEVTTEVTTELVTEAVTEAATEAVTGAITEAATEKATEVITEGTTEETTQEQAQAAVAGKKDYSHVASEAWGSFLGLADSAIESMINTTEKWRGKAAEAWEGAKAYFNEYMEKVPGWIDEGTKFLQEKSDKMSKNVLSAWETVKEGAQEVGSHTMEEIQKAKEDMMAWIAEHADSKEDAEAVEAVQRTIDMAELQLELWEAKLTMAEEFFTEKKEEADAAILDAWTVIKEGYEEAGSHTAEEIEKADETLQAYLAEQKDISEEILESVKDLAESAKALAE